MTNPKFRILLRAGSTEKEIETEEFRDEAHAREILAKRGWTVESVEPYQEPIIEPPPEVAITTAPWLSGHPQAVEIGIVSAECIFGQNVFKDIGAGLSNFFGGRSELMQQTFREARNTVLSELKREAIAIGADGIVAVDLRYQTVSGNPGDMLMAYAVGTAVKLTREGGTNAGD